MTKLSTVMTAINKSGARDLLEFAFFVAVGISASSAGLI